MKRETMFKGCLVAALLAVVGFAMPAFAGSLEPPASAVDGSGNPVPTMRSMDELLPAWNQILPDSKRYVSVMNNEGVLDKETGIIWAKSLYLSSGSVYKTDWDNARRDCWFLRIGQRFGWRLPTAREVKSLGNINGVIPLAMFDAVNLAAQGFFWTSSERSSGIAYVFQVSSLGGTGSNTTQDKVTGSAALWCVRTPVDLQYKY